jgi:hypothetical protein
MAGQGIVIASYSYNTETDLGGLKQVLEQPNMNMSPGKHYSFSVGQLAWHLIAGMSSGIIFDFVTYYSSYVLCYFRRLGSDLRSDLQIGLPTTYCTRLPGGATEDICCKGWR